MKKQNKFKKTKLSSNMAVDVNLLCRLCLNNCNEANANHIFDSAGSSLTLKIMACSGLEVKNNFILILVGELNLSNHSYFHR